MVPHQEAVGRAMMDLAMVNVRNRDKKLRICQASPRTGHSHCVAADKQHSVIMNARDSGRVGLYFIQPDA
jgi:hypothetical protein